MTDTPNPRRLNKSKAQALIARNIRRLRTASGLSQEALAALAGIHRTYLSSVERAERNLTVSNLFRIAEALGVDPRELLRPIDGRHG